MLRRFERLNRLRILLRNNSKPLPELLKQISPILTSLCGGDILSSMTPFIARKSSAKSARFQRLVPSTYDSLLLYLNSLTTRYQSISTLPLQPLLPVLSPHVELLRTVSRGGRKFSTFDYHKGNSNVAVSNPISNKQCLGRIELIFRCYEQAEMGQENIFVGFRQFAELSEAETEASPFTSYPYVRGTLLSQQLGDLVVLRLSDVENHVAVLPLELGLSRRIEKPLYACISLHDVVV